MTTILLVYVLCVQKIMFNAYGVIPELHFSLLKISFLVFFNENIKNGFTQPPFPLLRNASRRKQKLLNEKGHSF